jgi:monoamine oxidase
MQRSRRDFIKSVLAGSACLPLASCASLDQWLMGENREETDKVLIVGAGLAGLTAAYFLKKNKIPFQIFEGSQRIGGRVWTLQNFNSASQHGELGGEQIEMDQMAIQNLAKELKVSVQEFGSKESVSWFEKNRFRNSKDDKKDQQQLTKLFQRVQQEAYGNSTQTLNLQNRGQFVKAVLLDQMSVAELLDRLQPQMKDWMRPFLEQITRSEWGVEPKEISALHLIHWMRDPSRLQNRKYLKISGGNSVLVQALFDRVGGIIPEKFIKFGYQLAEIKTSENGWSLFFRTAKGKIEVKGRRIICTLPPTLLRSVEGWEQIPTSEQAKQLLKNLGMGTHGKVLTSFRDRFWKNDAVLSNGGSWYTDLPTMQISEAGDHPLKVTASKGILQSQLGGVLGENSGLHSVDQMLKDLSKINSESGTAFENISHVQNWKRHPWSQGSRIYLKPGQFQLFDLNLNGLNQIKNGSGWALAGDAYDLAGLGTMNGSIQSATDAVTAFAKA